MRKITASAFASLDGVIQAPGGPEEDPTGGFAFGGWTAPYWDEGLGGAMGEILGRPFELLLGRKTYDIFAAHWPYVTDPNDPVAGLFNRITKYVASRTNPKLAWKNSQLLDGDAIQSLKTLKAGDGPDLLVQGSSDFLQTLWKNALVDEFTVVIFPVVLGKRKALVWRSRRARRVEAGKNSELSHRRDCRPLRARRRSDDRRFLASRTDRGRTRAAPELELSSMLTLLPPSSASRRSRSRGRAGTGSGVRTSARN